METTPQFGIVIPVYRHEEPLRGVLSRLVRYGVPCFIVDDGNDVPIQKTLETELARYPWVSVLRLATHRGKGTACIEGARAAQASRCSHAIFIDADDQHEVDDIPRVMALAREHPQAMILGRPVFDASAPLKRRIGRIVSNTWVWIETWSLDIQDSLFGFRCFPLAPFLKVAASLGRGMNFDADVVVRLFWDGVPVVNFDTPIRYPSEGVSNFRMGRDNLGLVRLHTRLFFGMLLRSPFLLSRRLRHD